MYFQLFLQLIPFPWSTFHYQMNGKKTKAVALASNAYIVINVSGRRFKTDEKILERYPGINTKKKY